jgi:hypothetical protein
MRTLLSLAILALAAAPAAAQDPLEDLKKEIEGLKKRVTDLEKQNADLQRTADEACEEVIRLRMALKEAVARGSAAPAKPANGDGPVPARDPVADPKEEVGPEKVMSGKVLDVNPEFNFIVLNLGEVDGVRPGFRFEVIRKDREGKMSRVAVCEFEKFIGQSKAQSKLKITEGHAKDVKVGDEAFAFRKIKVERPDGGGAVKAPAAAKKHTITGASEGTFWINFGSKDGARQTDTVFVYRDNKLMAKLRLETVDKDWSAAKVIDGTLRGELVIGDEVALKEMKTSAIGTVKFNDEKRGLILDVGQNNHNVRVGQKFEVRRNGRKVGEVSVIKVDKWHSYAEPSADTKREDIQVNDIVESIE